MKFDFFFLYPFIIIFNYFPQVVPHISCTFVYQRNFPTLSPIIPIVCPFHSLCPVFLLLILIGCGLFISCIVTLILIGCCWSYSTS